MWLNAQSLTFYEGNITLTGYPLAVKLGTITKDGKGDVWSYVEDDMVEDPHLVKHLSHWGINASVLEKVGYFFLSSFICRFLSVHNFLCYC